MLIVVKKQTKLLKKAQKLVFLLCLLCTVIDGVYETLFEVQMLKC